MSALPKDGILTPEHKQRLQTLKHFIEELPGGKAEEIILAFSPTTYGDTNANIVGDQLRNLAGKITRLARGIPTGGEIEFADEETLQNALKNRN
jgi:recombination protein RecR